MKLARLMVMVMVVVVTLTLLLARASEAQQGSVLKQDRSAGGEGYTVLRVWGTPQEMGYAQGFLLAKDALAMLGEVKSKLGSAFALASTAMAAAVWKPSALEQELEGVVAGVKAAQPGAAVELADLKVVNTLGDWMYFACRSHSCWGSRVNGPTHTLSTRRLDFPTPVPSTMHHVMVARAPSDGGVRWLNLGWAGMSTAVTAVNEYGTLASLHDYKSKMVAGAHMPRMVAVRYALTLVAGLPLEQHLDAVYDALQKQSVMTGTFINYYVPEGHGGVITCPPGLPCTKKRLPQIGYFGGEVLLTTNQETDGLSAPPDDAFMDGYYKTGGPKTIADHHALMGHGGLHLLSVDYRGRNDMTVWAEGRLSSGVTPTIKIEWSELFPATPPAGDGARPADGARLADGGQTVPDLPLWKGEADALPAGGSGCSCSLSSSAAGPELWLLLAAMGLALAGLSRRRGGTASRIG